MLKNKIVIGSVLKPVNDVRMYEKFAKSLITIPNLEIHIIGQAALLESNEPNIFFHSLFRFKRLNWQRTLAPIKFLKLLLKLKPQITIVNTHELLIAACIYKAFHKTKIIYDVRENYFRNILYTHAFPVFLRPLVAFWVRVKEIFTRPLVTHYLIAEKNYESEFYFSKRKSTLIENKYKGELIQNEVPKNQSNSNLNLLISGTLAQSYGVFEGIEFAKKLNQILPTTRLTIVGYSPQNATLMRIKEIIKNESFITLIGGDTLVPYPIIKEEIKKANFGLLCYQSNKSTDHCIPTKLYEYLANQLPMVIPNNPLWSSITSPYPAAIAIDFQNYQIESVLNQMLNTGFYVKKPLNDVLWDSEAKKLINTIQNLLES